MYRFINHRCQEKNDMRVKKRSTASDRKISLAEEIGDEIRCARGKFCAIASRSLDARISFLAFCFGVLAHKLCERFVASRSAFDHIQRETREAGLLVARLHIEAGEIHRADDLIERDLVRF